ncbi:MAG: archaellin/type IV pilin N-terminal domain-containing protein [Candidatus Nanohalobium sp.]
MSKLGKLTQRRKGITPVIATVLLLGITVALGLTVYTQAQGLIGDLGGGGKLKKVQHTSLKLTPVYGKGNQMKVRVTNTGERAINTSKFSMYFGPPNFPNPVSYTALPDKWTVSANDNQCMTADASQVLSKGEHHACLTGVKFPGALEKVEIQVRANNFDYSTSKVCEVKNSGAKSC